MNTGKLKIFTNLLLKRGLEIITGPAKNYFNYDSKLHLHRVILNSNSENFIRIEIKDKNELTWKSPKKAIEITTEIFFNDKELEESFKNSKGNI